MAGVIRAPLGLGDKGKRLWRRCYEQLVAQGTWVQTDQEALERYVRTVLRGHEARKTADRLLALSLDAFEAAEDDDAAKRADAMRADSLRFYRLARQSENDAASYEEALILNPRARKRHDVKVREKAGELDAALG